MFLTVDGLSLVMALGFNSGCVMHWGQRRVWISGRPWLHPWASKFKHTEMKIRFECRDVPSNSSFSIRF